MRRLIIIGLVLGSAVLLLDLTLNIFKPSSFNNIAGPITFIAVAIVMAVRLLQPSDIVLNVSRVLAGAGLVTTLFRVVSDFQSVLNTRGTNMGLGTNPDLTSLVLMFTNSLGYQIIIMALLCTAFLPKTSVDPVTPAEIFK